MEIMSIELLYLIPIIAVVFFAFSVSFFSQKKSMEPKSSKKLASEVQKFNDGQFIPAYKSDNRINEFDIAVDSVNKALEGQQKIIEKFAEGNSAYNFEIDILKKQIVDLHREYDIAMSENYALRAKMRKLEKTPDHVIAAPTVDSIVNKPETFISSNTIQPKYGFAVNMSLFDDTKVYKVNSLDETREFDISDLMK
jgi:hypothetical protein